MKRNAFHGLLKTEQNGISRLINADNYSDIDRLLRVTAYVLFFVQKLKGDNPSFSELTVQLETLWVIQVQTPFKEDGRLDIWKKQLNLFLDSAGIWRCGGRLLNARLPYSTRFPILLSGKHHFMTLIIQRAHLRVFHNGTKETLTELQSCYWVVKGRRAVGQFIRHCYICRRIEAQAYRAPPPSPLPPFRVQEEPLSPIQESTSLVHYTSRPPLLIQMPATRFGYVCTHVVLRELSTWTWCQTYHPNPSCTPSSVLLPS